MTNDFQNDRFLCRNLSDFLIDVTPPDQSTSTQNQNQDISELVHQMKTLSNILVHKCKQQDHAGYLNALVIQHELNLIQPTVIDLSSSLPIPVNLIKTEPQLIPPNSFSKAKTARRRKFNYGVVNSREILTKLKEDEEAKQKIQQEKDERKALREEKKLLKNISLKIKKEEKDIDGLVSDEPIPKKSRGRPKKNILYQ